MARRPRSPRRRPAREWPGAPSVRRRLIRDEVLLHRLAQQRGRHHALREDEVIEPLPVEARAELALRLLADLEQPAVAHEIGGRLCRSPEGVTLHLLL